jgi:hypothetical protein
LTAGTGACGLIQFPVGSGGTMLVSGSLQAWDSDRGLYQPLTRICVGVAVACLALGAVRPPPLVLGLALVLLLAIPWGFAVAHRLASGDDAPVGWPCGVPVGTPWQRNRRLTSIRK